MGGNDSKENLVRLTAEEHYVAHQLLVKMYPDHHGIVLAAHMMSVCGKLHKRNNNKSYAWLRRRLSKTMSKIKTGKSGGLRSQEAKDKMSAASKGVSKSEAHKLALSKAKTGMKLKPHSEEAKRKISESNKASAKHRDFSHMQDENYKLTQSKKMKEIWAMRKSGIIQSVSQNKGK